MYYLVASSRYYERTRIMKICKGFDSHTNAFARPWIRTLIMSTVKRDIVNQRSEEEARALLRIHFMSCEWVDLANSIDLLHKYINLKKFRK